MGFRNMVFIGIILIKDFVTVHRKKTILFSHVFAFLGAASSTACVVAGSPELLMIGRVLVGVNSGMIAHASVMCMPLSESD